MASAPGLLHTGSKVPALLVVLWENRRRAKMKKKQGGHCGFTRPPARLHLAFSQRLAKAVKVCALMGLCR
jgi:hypothetical protein